MNKRLEDHLAGRYRDSFTFNRRPLELVFYAEFTEPGFAIDMEKQIKKWSRVKKEALIDERIDNLPNLAKKKFKR